MTSIHIYENRRFVNEICALQRIIFSLFTPMQKKAPFTTIVYILFGCNTAGILIK